MAKDNCLEKINVKECGSIEKLEANNRKLKYIIINSFEKENYEYNMISDPIYGYKIEYLCNELEALNKFTFENDFDKVIQAGGLGELMVCSILKMDLLSGTATRGPDAILLDDSDLSYNLKAGRYQIKYCDDNVSDIRFRVDITTNDGDKKLFQKYAWDYLLIATHGTREKNNDKKDYSIKPVNFYAIPLKCAIRLSEDLNDEEDFKESNKGKNKYLEFRINWTSIRKGKGNTGSKKNCIQSKFRINLKETKFNDVRLVNRPK